MVKPSGPAIEALEADNLLLCVLHIVLFPVQGCGVW